MDNLKAKGLCPTKAVKISQAVSCFGGAVLLLILELHIRGSLWHYVPKEDIYISFILLFLLGACLFISSSGYLTALASIAPSYSGFVTSVVFVFQIIGAYLSSSVIIHHNMVVRGFTNGLFLKLLSRMHQENGESLYSLFHVHWYSVELYFLSSDQEKHPSGVLLDKDNHTGKKVRNLCFSRNHVRSLGH